MPESYQRCPKCGMFPMIIERSWGDRFQFQDFECIGCGERWQYDAVAETWLRMFV